MLKLTRFKTVTLMLSASAVLALSGCGSSGTPSDSGLGDTTPTVTPPPPVTPPTGNTAPVADAGVDQNVSQGSVVSLDGSGSSDTDGDTLTYSWTLTAPSGSSATLSDATIVNPTFTADIAGTYTVELIVNDGTENSPGDSITVVASPLSCVPDFDVMMVVGYPYQPQGALDDGLNGAGISSLAFSLDGSKAYTITTDSYIQNDLMSIDPATGVGTTIAQVENDDHISDLATQPVTGALYGLYWGDLEVVNTTDATVTVLGGVSNNSPSGIAFDTNGTLYQVDRNATGFNHIFTLDPTDGSHLNGKLVQGVAQNYSFMGLGYNPDDGLLYAASRTDPGDIYTIDPSTGVATLVGSVDCPVGGTCYLHDIDFHPTTGVMYGAIGGADGSTNPDDLVGAFVKWGCK